ncbi:hypothetical protein N7462_002792 [Penicillium macrosclerotiorum]|uniref:uncharacterized protein n=1 Tax=Penicillium macrosclerotiorum TaxID=303699 RepID=UPI0025467E93|nr:uncharacterized protein N7462_002792 [Penicillium macrosclerotiorum]KAJ5693369.1 hypothetical protein N7462_002792 [Penicillium macrosclerotiorum]
MSVGSSSVSQQDGSSTSSVANTRQPGPSGGDSTSSVVNASLQGPDAHTVSELAPDQESALKSSAPEKATQFTAPSTLLTSLWSPISSLLQRPAADAQQDPETASSEQQNGRETPSTPISSLSQPPEPYYAPVEVPSFKALQKKRLSGTRTKQLLRAASRAHDDPPPPPELGSCCGSSCDPCVNDLWKEERGVWRERWGDRRIEKDSAGGRGGRNWSGKSVAKMPCE